MKGTTKLQAVWSILVLVLVIGIGVNVIRVLLKRSAHAASGPVVPYTCMLRESVRDNSGRETASYIETYAVRTDGAYMFRSAGPIGTPTENTLRIIEIPSGVHIEVRDLWDLKSTWMKPGVPKLRDANNSCLFPSTIPEVVLGTETISGFGAIKIGLNGATSWYAADYGCALVKAQQTWGGGATTTKTLASLAPGEPEKSLFYVPDTFREVPPSLIVNGPNGGASACCRSDAMQTQRQQAAMAKLDRTYSEHRPPVSLQK